MFKSTSVFALKSGFLTHLLVEQLRPSPYTFVSRQSHFSHPSQKSLEKRKEMAFGHRLPKITDLVFRGLYCPSSQNMMKKVLHEITVSNQV